MGSYQYRLIKSTWGIAIDVSGDYKIIKKVPNSKIAIDKNIWLNLQVSNLDAEERENVIDGVTLATNNIQNKFSNKKKYLLTISEIFFNICDYQKEGLLYATWGWVNTEFGIQPPETEVIFDKNENKYIFNQEYRIN